MKTIRVAMILLAAVALCTPSLNAQCEPDTTNCKDDDGIPGQLCPRTLPDGTVDRYYKSVITVIPPAEVNLGGLSASIVYITLDSVNNLPEGLHWQANAEHFYADSAYCVVISGTPVEAGTDTLSITVTPYGYLLGTITPGPPVVDDTSVVLNINEPSGIDPERIHEFQVFPNIPNPFSDRTRIRFYTPADDQVVLRVYDITGTIILEEKRGASPGEHHFDFNGEKLLPGTYFYRVSNRKGFHTGKFVKVGR